MRLSPTIALFVAIAACGALACGGTVSEPTSPGPDGISPQPQPNPGRDVRLRPERVKARVAGGRVTLTGGEGAVGWPGTLWMANVDGGAITRAVVPADGTFEAEGAWGDGAVLRLQMESEGSISPAYDVVPQKDGTIREVTSESCAARATPRQVGTLYAAVGSHQQERVEIANPCDHPVVVESVTLEDGGAFSLSGGAAPFTVPANGATAFDVVYTPRERDTAIGLLVLRVRAPAEKVAVTLIGHTPR